MRSHLEYLDSQMMPTQRPTHGTRRKWTTADETYVIKSAREKVSNTEVETRNNKCKAQRGVLGNTLHVRCLSVFSTGGRGTGRSGSVPRGKQRSGGSLYLPAVQPQPVDGPPRVADQRAHAGREAQRADGGVQLRQHA